MSETPIARSDSPATNDSVRGKIYIDTCPGSSPVTSLSSQNYFTDELLIALEKAGKSLLEIVSLILPFNEVDPPAIVVDGFEFYNDDDPSSMPEKKVRIRELLDAVFEDKNGFHTRLDEVEKKKKVLAKEMKNTEKKRQLLTDEKKTAEARFRFLALTAKNRFGVTKSKDGLNARKRQREAEAASSAAENILTEEPGEAVETRKHKKARVSESSHKQKDSIVHEPKREQNTKKESPQRKIKEEPGLKSSNFTASWNAREDTLHSTETSKLVAAQAQTSPTSAINEYQASSNRSAKPSPTHLSATPLVSESIPSRKAEQEVTLPNSVKSCPSVAMKSDAHGDLDKTVVPVINDEERLLSDTVMTDEGMDAELFSNDGSLDALSATESPHEVASASVREVAIQADVEIAAKLGTLMKSGAPTEKLLEIPAKNRMQENTPGSNLGFIAVGRIDDTAANDNFQPDVSHHLGLPPPNETALVSSWSKRVLSADLHDDDKSSEEAEFTDSAVTPDGMSTSSSHSSIKEQVAAADHADNSDEWENEDNEDEADEHQDWHEDKHEDEQENDHEKEPEGEDRDGDENGDEDGVDDGVEEQAGEEGGVEDEEGEDGGAEDEDTGERGDEVE